MRRHRISEEGGGVTNIEEEEGVDICWCAEIHQRHPSSQSLFASVSPSIGSSCGICPNSAAVRLRGAEVQAMVV